MYSSLISRALVLDLVLSGYRLTCMTVKNLQGPNDHSKKIVFKDNLRKDNATNSTFGMSHTKYYPARTRKTLIEKVLILYEK